MSPSPWREFKIKPDQQLSPEFTPATVVVVEPAPKKRRRGNPNWGGKATIESQRIVADGQTAFEKFVAERQIPEEAWAKSRELRLWVGKNLTQRYVPEDLLVAYGLDERVNNRFERFCERIL